MRGAVGFVALLAATTLGVGAVSLREDLVYYTQSIRGHLALMAAARPIDAVIADPALPRVLQTRLGLARSIRDYASRELALPDNGSYRSYADLGRPYALWNVFAASELSLDLKTWCVPVAGCVPYHGWYSLDDARAEADSLRAQGYDVQVAGVPAYSTLGWFNDPVLNTFVAWPEGELARLLFHELAHQVVYVPGDATFNESFATAVELAGVDRWLAAQGDSALEGRYRRFDTRRRQFIELLQGARERLVEVYESEGDAAARRVGKARVLARLQADYATLRQSWGGWSGYDAWFADHPGNAHLGAVSTYTALVPAFTRELAACQNRMPCFFDRIKTIARLDPDARARRLAL